jgi:hypothetical protein
VPYQSLYNHRSKHLPAELVKAKDETVEDATKALVNELQQITEKTEQIAARALAPKTYSPLVALKALSQRARQIELKARLLGQLEDRNPAPSQISVVYVDKQLNVAGNPAPMNRAALPAPNREEEQL